MGQANVMVPKGPRARQARVNEPPDYTRGMPDWWEPRDTQLDAVEKVAGMFEAGARVVFVDAPTGTGKTSIGELVRRRLAVDRGLYVCTTKSLQDQVLRDFDNARALKGRQNYTPNGLITRQATGYRQGDGGRDALGITCGDCDVSGPEGAEHCSYCTIVDDCPYRVAREQAEHAELGVLNTALLLTLQGGQFRDRELVIADECDTLEGQLLGYVELKVGKRWVERAGVEVPKKGSHMTTIRAWLDEELVPALERLEPSRRTLEERRDYKRWQNLLTDVHRVIDREDGWVRDGDDEERDGGGLVLKPVSIEDVGERYLWKHGQRWLCMSGTIVSAEQMAESLGLEDAGIDWNVVRLEMPFARENRPVRYVPSGLMTRKGQEARGLDGVLAGLDKVLEKHPGVNVLVHTFNYTLARQVSEHLRGKGGNVTVDGRHVFTYTNASAREGALGGFRRAKDRGGAVLVAASMDRGIDLPGDDCRVQVIVKMPMASLGSRQVSERMRTPGGKMWYLASTCRTVMQQTGRAVRGVDDWAVCYILDSHFGQVLKDGKRYGMFPQWWLDGLELGRL